MIPRAQASLCTRTTTPEVLDAGLSAQSTVGAFDVGLCVKADAIGVILSAPRLGVLKLAFNVTSTGTTHLAKAIHASHGGVEHAIETPEAQRIQELEAEIKRLRALLPPES
jgi:hypothetical protein